MPGQGDIAAAAGAGPPHTHIATFELIGVTFLVCGLLLPANLVDAGYQESEEQ